MSHNQVFIDLALMPKCRLQAIYNACWRKRNNGVSDDTTDFVFTCIEAIAGLENWKVTGHGGSWVFEDQPTTPNNRHHRKAC